MEKSYIAIDLKSFYASVECRERDMDPMDTNLVVADESRTEKTICLAVSPSLKSFGIPGRPRLFEVVQRVREVNREREYRVKGRKLRGESVRGSELAGHPELAVAYLVARPRMALYMKYSTQIYEIYLKYIAPEDIHVYSIDEVLIDVTPYLNTYRMTPRELARKMIADVWQNTGITATAGIGTNLYLAKIAMDIVAKHMPADKDGVRIAELDEMSYRRLLWGHEPLTDFWRVGKGYAQKLRKNGMRTMGDVARCSLGGPADYHNEELLYRLFGVNAELLIDHAWGWEPVGLREIKAYRPSSSSMGAGQVLQEPYTHEKAALIVWEMTDQLVLDLVEKGLVTDRMILDIGYDVENMKKSGPACGGEVHIDRYGRAVPKPAHGSVNLGRYTSSTKLILKAVSELYERITDPRLLVRRITVTAGRVIFEEDAPGDEPEQEQLDLFTDYAQAEKAKVQEAEDVRKEKSLQKAMIGIKHRFGKNSLLKGANLQEGGTAVERNAQIGGHKA